MFSGTQLQKKVRRPRNDDFVNEEMPTYGHIGDRFRNLQTGYDDEDQIFRR